MRFRYIGPQYGFGPKFDHIALPEAAQDLLWKMSRELVGTDDLIAIYIPEGTEAGYPANNMRGKVVDAVCLLNMPAGRGINDYFYNDLEGKRRWPIGWPCVAVLHPPIDECPTLRTLVEKNHGPNSFGPYVKRFQRGPFALDRPVSIELSRWFTRLATQSN
ncbi:MAG TPA: hypothetical protein VKI44_09430 [Acetobacteraceae bacterium]|nr:hypothetical protein [Acetobacteraceae bacterium]